MEFGSDREGQDSAPDQADTLGSYPPELLANARRATHAWHEGRRLNEKLLPIEVLNIRRPPEDYWDDEAKIRQFYQEHRPPRRPVDEVLEVSSDGWLIFFPIGIDAAARQNADISKKMRDVLPRRPEDYSQPHPELTPEEREALDFHHQRLLFADPGGWQELIHDPDKGKKAHHSIYEAQSVQGLVADERIPPEVFRPRVRQGEGGDFVIRDEEGRAKTTLELKGIFSERPPWSNQRDASKPFAQSYNNSPETFMKKLDRVAPNQDKLLVLDTRFANGEAIEDLSARVAEKKWRDHVIWYP